MKEKKQKPRVHYLAPYLAYPVHRIPVLLVGCGGTGSAMLNALARIDHALYTLGAQGLHVTVADPDTVSESNIGRQLFAAADIGQNKATCLVSKINRFYGLDWCAADRKVQTHDVTEANIVITTVDNIAARLDVAAAFANGRAQEGPRGQYYWMDIGNTRRSGQVILGSNTIAQPKIRGAETVDRLPTATEMFDYTAIDEKDSGPSCSLAEALSKQDLFINTTLAQMAGSLLWNLLHEGNTTSRGFFLNLENFTGQPISV